MHGIDIKAEKRREKKQPPIFGENSDVVNVFNRVLSARATTKKAPQLSSFFDLLFALNV